MHAILRTLPHRPAFAAPLALSPHRAYRLIQARRSRRAPNPRAYSVRAAMAAAPATLGAAAASVAGAQPAFAQTMLRVSDPEASIAFYEGLGLRRLASLAFPEYSFSLYFLASTADAPLPAPDASRKDTAMWMWSRPYPTLELTHNWPSDEPAEQYVSGNDRPRGFGHLALAVSAAAAAAAPAADVAALGADLPGESATCVKDPDGYAVKLVGSNDAGVVYARAMLRVRDPTKMVAFLERLGMRRLARVEADGASHFFMGYAGEDEGAPEGADAETIVRWLCGFRGAVVHLRHDWAVPDETLTSGNEKPHRGFGHLGILVDDIYEVMKKMEDSGYGVVRKPSPFLDVGAIAFVKDDDVGYWVELIQREGGAPAAPYRKE